MGIPIKLSKIIPLSNVVPVHGIEVDFVRGEALLPLDKLQHLITLLQQFTGKRSYQLREWQSLTGHLSFASWVIRPGRPFIRNFIDRICSVHMRSHYIKLTSEIHHDCRM